VFNPLLSDRSFIPSIRDILSYFLHFLLTLPSSYDLFSPSFSRPVLTTTFFPTSLPYLCLSLPLPLSFLSGEVGHFLVSIAFEEDMKGLFTGDSTIVRRAPQAPEEPMSMERLSVHISRFQSVCCNVDKRRILGIQKICCLFDCSVFLFDATVEERIYCDSISAAFFHGLL
jgi:hypothetical protein